MRSFLLTFLLLLTLPFYGQNLRKAKRLVKELSSEKYYGRGYVNKGDSLAADYLGQYMDKMGLNKYDGIRFQDYSVSVNTWPTTISLRIDDKQLELGEDYLIETSSFPVQGSFPIVKLNKSTMKSGRKLSKVLNSDLSNSFMLVDTTGINNPELHLFAQNLLTSGVLKNKGTVISSKRKVRSGGASFVSDNFNIHVNRGIVNPKADSIHIDAQSVFVEDYKTRNVIGFIQGQVDTCIVFCAHYDHLGMMGDIMFPGANDNASGVAMVLDMASHYLKQKDNYYSKLFILFSGEEIGLKGSKHYVDNPVYPMDKTLMAINFDMVGNGDGGTYIFNAKAYKGVWDRFDQINKEKDYLKILYGGGMTCSSDHCPFHLKGKEGLFFYTEIGDDQKLYYHQPKDKENTINYSAYKGIFRLVRDYVQGLRD
ncbi:MAG: M28 family metallopeptidase [Hyphomicrobiales bacterium]